MQSSMHSSQMKTPGPAIRRRTSLCGLPQNEQQISLPFCHRCLPLYHLISSAGNYLVDQAVFHGLFRRHEIVAVSVALNYFKRLPGAFRQKLIQQFLLVGKIVGMNHNIRHLRLRQPAARLMNQNIGVRQRDSVCPSCRPPEGTSPCWRQGPCRWSKRRI